MQKRLFHCDLYNGQPRLSAVSGLANETFKLTPKTDFQ